jgi:hypothetical protein
MTLTGRKRYRHKNRLFGKPLLVLQLEYTYVKTYDLSGSGYFDHQTITHWRDATAEDLTIMEPVK